MNASFWNSAVDGDTEWFDDLNLQVGASSMTSHKTTVGSIPTYSFFNEIPQKPLADRHEVGKKSANLLLTNERKSIYI